MEGYERRERLEEDRPAEGKRRNTGAPVSGPQGQDRGRWEDSLSGRSYTQPRGAYLDWTSLGGRAETGRARICVHSTQKSGFMDQAQPPLVSYPVGIAAEHGTRHQSGQPRFYQDRGSNSVHETVSHSLTLQAYRVTFGGSTRREKYPATMGFSSMAVAKGGVVSCSPQFLVSNHDVGCFATRSADTKATSTGACEVSTKDGVCTPYCMDILRTTSSGVTTVPISDGHARHDHRNTERFDTVGLTPKQWD